MPLPGRLSNWSASGGSQSSRPSHPALVTMRRRAAASGSSGAASNAIKSAPHAIGTNPTCDCATNDASTTAIDSARRSPAQAAALTNSSAASGSSVTCGSSR